MVKLQESGTPTVEPNPGNIILRTRTNDLKTIDTPEEISMGIPDHRPPQYKFREKQISRLQQTVLSKTDILLLSETKIDDSFPDSQFFAESFKMYRKDRTKTGRLLL